MASPAEASSGPAWARRPGRSPPAKRSPKKTGNLPPSIPEWQLQPGEEDARATLTGGRPSSKPMSCRRYRQGPAAAALTPDVVQPYAAPGPSWNIITPNGLHYERHHAGVPTIDPLEHRPSDRARARRAAAHLHHGVDLTRFPSVSRVHFLECSGQHPELERAQTRTDGPGQHVRMDLLSCCEWTTRRSPVNSIAAESSAGGRPQCRPGFGGPGRQARRHLATAIGVQAIEHHRKRVRLFSTVANSSTLLEQEKLQGKAGTDRGAPSPTPTSSSWTNSATCRLLSGGALLFHLLEQALREQTSVIITTNLEASASGQPCSATRRFHDASLTEQRRTSFQALRLGLGIVRFAKAYPWRVACLSTTSFRSQSNMT